MTAQSEPDGGTWQDRNGHVWRKTSDVWENLRDGVWLSWSDLCRDYGPLIPELEGNYQSATSESQSGSKLDGEGAGVEASASGADSRSPASEMRTEAVPFLSPEPPFFPLDYSPRELIQVAMGAASMCWENPGGAGVFDSDRASFIADELCERLGIGDPDLVPVMLSREIRWLVENNPNAADEDIGAAVRAALEANPRSEL